MILMEADIARMFREEILIQLDREISLQNQESARSDLQKVVVWINSVTDDGFFTSHGSTMLSPSELLRLVLTAEGQRELRACAVRLKFSLPFLPQIGKGR